MYYQFWQRQNVVFGCPAHINKILTVLGQLHYPLSFTARDNMLTRYSVGNDMITVICYHYHDSSDGWCSRRNIAVTFSDDHFSPPDKRKVCYQYKLYLSLTDSGVVNGPVNVYRNGKDCYHLNFSNNLLHGYQ